VRRPWPGLVPGAAYKGGRWDAVSPPEKVAPQDAWNAGSVEGPRHRLGELLRSVVGQIKVLPARRHLLAYRCGPVFALSILWPSECCRSLRQNRVQGRPADVGDLIALEGGRMEALGGPRPTPSRPRAAPSRRRLVLSFVKSSFDALLALDDTCRKQPRPVCGGAETRDRLFRAGRSE
jgi:hypothetical protein